MNNEMDPRLVTALEKKLKEWLRNGKIFAVVHWTVGILGTAMSTLAAAKILPDLTSVFSVGAAVCFGVLGFVDPKRRSTKYLRSYNMLNTALYNYEFKDPAASTLIKTYNIAEGALWDTDNSDERDKSLKDFKNPDENEHEKPHA